MSALLNEHDFAVVMGISHYFEHEELPDLESPENDCAVIGNWLRDPAGGALAAENLLALNSPSRVEAEGAFGQVFARFVDEPGRRLYIYASGHGFANGTNQAALWLADASPRYPGNAIDLRAFADAAYADGLFTEVVLFAEFSRRASARGNAFGPAWSNAEPTQKGEAYFYGFSARMGEESYAIKYSNEQSAQSLFTRALLEGLNGGAAGGTGLIDSTMLQAFVEQHLKGSLEKSNVPFTQPEFISGGARSIVFSEGEAVSVAQVGTKTDPEPEDESPPSEVQNVNVTFSDSRLSMVGLGSTEVAPAARDLLNAAIELLPQKRSSKKTLSASQLFMTAVAWGNLSDAPVAATPTVRNLASEVMNTRNTEFATLEAQYFENAPPNLTFQHDPDRVDDFKISETLDQAFDEIRGQSEPVTEADLLRAVFEYMETTAGKKSRLWTRMQDINLSLANLIAVLPAASDFESDHERAAKDLRRGFTNDSINAADPDADKLNVNAQARLFAELIMNPQVKPPLSIGLFGNWGSGKSFFMDRMHADMNELSGQAQRISRVIQVKFNAWHFVDANLWASLATKILDDVADELAKGLDDVASDEDVETKRATLRKAIESSRRHRSEASLELQTAVTERSKAKADYDKQRGRRLTEALKLGQSRWRKLETLAENDTDLKAALDGTKQVASRLGIDDVLSSADGLERLLAEAKAASHSASSLWRTLVSEFRQPSILFIVVVVVLVLWVVAQLTGYTPHAADWVRQLTAWGAPVGSVAAWLVTRLRSLAKGAEYVETLIKGTDDLDFTDTNELQGFDNAVHSAQTKMQEAERRHAEYEQELQRIDAGGLVYDFLESRRNNEAYLQYKGLISIVREDFEHLQTALQTIEATRPIDRIVLYIDDLDRCRPTRVVEVLEAVHMLLSFELFCVVVAVDSRWLRTSLEQSYRSLSGLNEATQKGDQPFTAQNYLEKIFQIPFSLPRMDEDGFARLVDAVLEPPSPAEKKPETPTFSADAASEGEVIESAPEGGITVTDTPQEKDLTDSLYAESHGESPTGTTGAQHDSKRWFSRAARWWKALHDVREADGPISAQADIKQNSPAPAEPPTQLLDDDPEPLEAEESDETSEVISLHDHERHFIHTLHEFVKTPRQTKRLVNIYRLLRPRPGTEALDAFAGRPDDPGYKCMLLLLAINTGYPAPAGKLISALASYPIGSEPEDPTRDTWIHFLDSIHPANKESLHSSRLWSDCRKKEIDVAQELFNQVSNLERLPHDLTEYKRYARQVGRYSFDWNMFLPSDVEERS